MSDNKDMGAPTKHGERGCYICGDSLDWDRDPGDTCSICEDVRSDLESRHGTTT